MLGVFRIGERDEGRLVFCWTGLTDVLPLCAREQCFELFFEFCFCVDVAQSRQVNVAREFEQSRIQRRQGV